eukprot:71464_1
MLLFVFGLVIIHIAKSMNCSALHSYVEVTIITTTSNIPFISILMSSQALFPPHSYYVPPTELISLPRTDPLCGDNPILSSDISNKIVLLFESQGNCSVHSKVITAQRKGAVAVLMANDETEDTVNKIMDDDTLAHIHTTIPMRSITKGDGKWLRRPAKPESETQVQVKFGCWGDITYPSMLCLRETSGVFWTLNGEYQRQDVQINGHPIWKLNGYPLSYKPLHIFLHDANGDTDWFWAVTHDASFVDDTALVLKCNVGDISDPSLCPSWSGIHGDQTDLNINITTDVCPSHTHQEFCVDSTQSQLAGTYALATDGVSEWVRKPSECDARSGVVLFMENGVYQGGFVVYDPLTDRINAYCFLSQLLNENIAYGTRRYRPDLCTQWKTAHTTDDTPDTFYITTGACLDPVGMCIPSDAPDTFCMTDNSMFHGHLMGEYSKTNDIGTVYTRVRPTNASANNARSYVWYRDDLLDHDHPTGWYLTDSIDQHDDEFKYYGYCQGYAFGNPVNCVGWVFEVGWTPQYDTEMIVSDGPCTSHIPPQHPGHGIGSWPQFVCVGLKNESDVDNAVFVGKYAMATSDPMWTKEDDEMYLSFTQDKVWSISEWNEDDTMANESVYEIRCDAYYKTKSLNPIDCAKWVDWNFVVVDDLYLYECAEIIDNEKDETDPLVGIVVGIVFAVLLVVGVTLMCIACRMKNVYKKKKDMTVAVEMDNIDHIHLASMSPVTVGST